jgi:hypothetical protein
MANWIGTARSSYFAVKDEAAFRAWAEKRDLQVLEPQRVLKQPGGTTQQMFGVAPTDGGWPTYDQENDEELDLMGELAELLQEGQIVVFQEVGAEKLRYVTANATAFDSTGKRIYIDLQDIYERASEYFDVPVGAIPACQY